jgi:polyglutamine-binding protein 1
VEAKDPGSGAFYYYNESTGKSQWEKPREASLTAQSTPSSHLPENWVEALDDTTGSSHKYPVVVFGHFMNFICYIFLI